MENFQNRAKTRSRLAKGKQRKDGKRLRNRPRNSQKPKEAAFQTTPTRSIFGGQLRSELSRDFPDPQMAKWPNGLDKAEDWAEVMVINTRSTQRTQCSRGKELMPLFKSRFQENSV